MILKGFQGSRCQGLPASGMDSSKMLKNYKERKVCQIFKEISGRLIDWKKNQKNKLLKRRAEP